MSEKRRSEVAKDNTSTVEEQERSAAHKHYKALKGNKPGTKVSSGRTSYVDDVQMFA